MSGFSAFVWFLVVLFFGAGGVIGWLIKPCPTPIDVRPGAAVVSVVRVQDTIWMPVQRPPLRVQDARPRVTREQQTIALDTTSGDTSHVQQSFTSQLDTLVGRDTVRESLAMTISAPRGPIDLLSLRSTISISSPVDSVPVARDIVRIEYQVPDGDDDWLREFGKATLWFLVGVAAKSTLDAAYTRNDGG